MQASLRLRWNVDKIGNLSKREIVLLAVLGAIFPIYPAISLQQTIAGKISVTRVALLCLLNALFVAYFGSKAFKKKMDIDIKQHLDAHYSNEQQKKLIKNYRAFKGKFFARPPLFTKEALGSDPILAAYHNAYERQMAKLLVGGFIFIVLSVGSFCLLVLL